MYDRRFHFIGIIESFHNLYKIGSCHFLIHASKLRKIIIEITTSCLFHHYQMTFVYLLMAVYIECWSMIQNFDDVGMVDSV